MASTVCLVKVVRSPQTAAGSHLVLTKAAVRGDAVLVEAPLVAMGSGAPPPSEAFAAVHAKLGECTF
jgi:hypothetical protein